MQKTYLTLDTKSAGSQATVQAKLGDTGRRLVISLTNGENPYEIPEDAYAVLMGSKPDGNVLYNAVAIQNQKLIYTFTEQTATAVGITECEVRLYRPNEAVLTTARFDLAVDGTVYSDTKVESTSEYTALKGLIAQVLEILQNRETAITELNGKLPDEVGHLILTSDSIDMDDGDGGWAGLNVTEAVDQVQSQIDDLARDVVRKVNGLIPEKTGNVLIGAEDISTQQEEWQFQGTVTAALDELCAMLKGKVSEETVKSLVADALANYATTGDVNAAIVNALTNYVTAQGLADTLAEALADYATADQVAKLPKKVNSIGPDAEGNVEITSDNIYMDDGEGGWGGFVLTDVIDELNQGIAAVPTESKINQLINAKLAELPAGGETDVQINGTSIVQGGVANIPLSGSLEYADGYLRVRQTAVENITQRVATRALTLDKLDVAVKAALCDEAGAAWTAEEQAAARARLGILTTEGVTF